MWRAFLVRFPSRGARVFILVGTLAIVVCLMVADTVPPRARTNMTMIGLRGELLTYVRRHGAPPTSLDDLPVDEKGAKPTVTDGWGRPIQLRVERSGILSLVSLGADDCPGGQGDAADLVGTFDPTSSTADWLVDPFGHPVLSTRP